VVVNWSWHARALRAFPRSEDGERGPALLDVLAATVWADDLALLVIHKGRIFAKSFLHLWQKNS
jgi:hypothetical protein